MRLLIILAVFAIAACSLYEGGSSISRRHQPDAGNPDNDGGHGPCGSGLPDGGYLPDAYTYYPDAYNGPPNDGGTGYVPDAYIGPIDAGHHH